MWWASEILARVVWRLSESPAVRFVAAMTAMGVSAAGALVVLRRRSRSR